MDRSGVQSPSDRGLIKGPANWLFSPEGAAIFETERLAVIADVHLGYEWARAASGDILPEHSLEETIAKLKRMLSRVAIDRLVVAGDLTESHLPCPRTSRDVFRLTQWLANRGITLVWLAGNHDRKRRPPLPSTLTVDGWTVGHGHRPIPGDRVVFGHHHPALRAPEITAPCFLFNDQMIALPAFSPNAAGLDLCSGRLPEILARQPLRCIAGTDSELLDFGPLDRLRRQAH